MESFIRTTVPAALRAAADIATAHKDNLEAAARRFDNIHVSGLREALVKAVATLDRVGDDSEQQWSRPLTLAAGVVKHAWFAWIDIASKTDASRQILAAAGAASELGVMGPGDGLKGWFEGTYNSSQGGSAKSGPPFHVVHTRFLYGIG